MIDLHSHILPGVDDGSKDITMSLEMAKEAEAQGISTIVATPHYMEEGYRVEKDEMKKKVAFLQEKIDEADIDIKVLTGSEVYSFANLVKEARDAKLTTINNSRYLLIEFPMTSIPKYTEELLANLQIMNYKPIIAHPERYLAVQKNPNLLYNWGKEGILAQLNVGSLLGAFGSRAEKTAEILVKHNLVQLIGSDAHFNYHHRGSFAEGVVRLKELVGNKVEAYFEAAENVIADKEIEFLSFCRYEEPKKSIFSMIKKKIGIGG